MKTILLFTCVITLLTTTGCLVSEGGRHGDARYESHSEVIVGPPAVEVRAPVVVVRPPEIIVPDPPSINRSTASDRACSTSRRKISGKSNTTSCQPPGTRPPLE